jgi:hypothetical protein
MVQQDKMKSLRRRELNQIGCKPYSKQFVDKKFRAAEQLSVVSGPSHRLTYPSLLICTSQCVHITKRYSKMIQVQYEIVFGLENNTNLSVSYNLPADRFHHVMNVVHQEQVGKRHVFIQLRFALQVSLQH